MPWSKESQARWISGATIFSLIAVPIILGVGGWLIQRQVAKEGVKQQYVQLALGILREPPAKENTDSQQLRSWAVKIVDENAALKLTDEDRQALFAQALPADSSKLSGGYRELAKYTTISCEEDYFLSQGKKRYEECLQKERIIASAFKTWAAIEEHSKDREEKK